MIKEDGVSPREQITSSCFVTWMATSLNGSIKAEPKGRKRKDLPSRSNLLVLLKLLLALHMNFQGFYTSKRYKTRWTGHQGHRSFRVASGSTTRQTWYPNHKFEKGIVFLGEILMLMSIILKSISLPSKQTNNSRTIFDINQRNQQCFIFNTIFTC